MLVKMESIGRLNVPHAGNFSSVLDSMGFQNLHIHLHPHLHLVWSHLKIPVSLHHQAYLPL